MIRFFKRKVIIPILYFLKVDQLLLYFSKPGFQNLLYHGVTPLNSNYFSPRHIDEKQFEKHLIYFKKNFDIISLSEYFERVRSGEKPEKNTIALSFDDGFRNNLDYALPLLEKHNVPCTFFISTVLIEDMEIRCLWADLVAVLNYCFEGDVVNLGEFEFLNGYDSKNNLYMTDYIKRVKYDEREKLLSKLIEDYDLVEKIKTVPEDFWKLMNLDELKRLNKSKLVSIGAHSYLHYNLGQIEIEKAEYELAHSKKMLEEVLQIPIEMLAYPDGDYTSKVKDIASSLGYKQQYAVSYRLDEDRQDTRIIDRFCISSTTTFESNILRLCSTFFKA